MKKLLPCLIVIFVLFPQNGFSLWKMYLAAEVKDKTCLYDLNDFTKKIGEMQKGEIVSIQKHYYAGNQKRENLFFKIYNYRLRKKGLIHSRDLILSSPLNAMLNANANVDMKFMQNRAIIYKSNGLKKIFEFFKEKYVSKIDCYYNEPFLFVALYNNDSNPFDVRIINLKTKTLVSKIDNKRLYFPIPIAYSSDKKYLAVDSGTMGYSRGLLIIDIKNNKTIFDSPFISKSIPKFENHCITFYRKVGEKAPDRPVLSRKSRKTYIAKVKWCKGKQRILEYHKVRDFDN